MIHHNYIQSPLQSSCPTHKVRKPPFLTTKLSWHSFNTNNTHTVTIIHTIAVTLTHIILSCWWRQEQGRVHTTRSSNNAHQLIINAHTHTLLRLHTHTVVDILTHIYADCNTHPLIYCISTLLSWLHSLTTPTSTYPSLATLLIPLPQTYNCVPNNNFIIKNWIQFNSDYQGNQRTPFSLIKNRAHICSAPNQPNNTTKSYQARDQPTPRTGEDSQKGFKEIRG